MNIWLKTLLIACISIFFSVENLSAQTVLEEIVEQLMNNDEDSSYQWESLMEELEELKEHPININTATKEQLERFPFLSDRMVENILYYIYKYGPMLSEQELMMVQDMDRQTYRYLLPFISFQQPLKESKSLTLKQILKYGKQELTARVDIPFYTKAGYQPFTPEEWKERSNKHYLGSKYYHNFRYQFRYSDKVYAGLTAEVDAGEPFFGRENSKGYDFYSPYLFIRNMGRINALAIGNYRLNYGCGLVMNTGFNLGKNATLATLITKATGIKKHSSTDEYNYFQGVAGSYRIAPRWTADAFYSYRTMDGTVDGQFITSLKKDGYHRLHRDMDKKNTFSNQLIGSNIQYDGKNFKAGLTAVYNVFNKTLNPEYRSYNKYYARGRDFFNVGVNYKYFWKQFTLVGETAVDKAGRLATMNMLRYATKESFQLMVMHRFYDVAYQGLYAQSAGEGSTVQNEHGIYIGLETNFLRYFKLTAYGDFFHFPWKKYQVSKLGTNGFDGVAQITYSPRYQLDMFIRYRYKNKCKDFTSDDDSKFVIPYIQQRWKYQLNYSPVDELILQTTVDMVLNGYQEKEASQGILIGQRAGYKWKKFPLQLDAGFAWFRTDDYASRIFMYEKGLLYTFSIPSFYGEGERYSFNLRYELSDYLVFQAKYALTHYRDREEIGSDLEQINGNVKSDLYLQLRLKF